MHDSSSLESLEGSLDSFRQELTENARVAVVAPKPAVRDTIDGLLRDKWLQTEVFENLQALEAGLGVQPVAVIVIDASGDFEAELERVRTMSRGDPALEFVLLTDSPDATKAVAAMESGVHDLLALPLEHPDVFTHRVVAALERWKRTVIDERITKQFHWLANSVYRPNDVMHRGAFERFTKKLDAFRKSLLSNRRLLLVSANAFAGERTKQFLESEGFEVVLANSIAESAEAAPKSDFRLLLADAELPDGTAFAAYSEVSRVHPDIEFLVVSTANALDVALEAMSGGARDCVLKPREGLDAIQQKVRRALRLQARHFKHLRLVDELRELCSELVGFDREAQAGGIMIKMDPGKSQATLKRFLGELHREEESRFQQTIEGTKRRAAG